MNRKVGGAGQERRERETCEKGQLLVLIHQGSIAAVADSVVLWIVSARAGGRRRCCRGSSRGDGCRGNLLVLLEGIPIPLLRVDGLIDIAIIDIVIVARVVARVITSVVVASVVVASVVAGSTVCVGVCRVRSNGLILSTKDGPVIVLIVQRSTLSNQGLSTMSPRQSLENEAQNDQSSNDTEHDVHVGSELVIDLGVRSKELLNGLDEACPSKEIDAGHSEIGTDDDGRGDQDLAAQHKSDDQTEDWGTNQQTDTTAFGTDETLVSPGKDVKSDRQACDTAQDPDQEGCKEPTDCTDDQAATNASKDVDDLAMVPTLIWLNVGEDGVHDDA